MRKTIIRIKTGKLNEKEKKKRVNFHPKKSTQVNRIFLGISSFFNILGKQDKDIAKIVYCDKFNITYLPVVYVEYLHGFIIRLYEKSDDPVISGYMSRANLEYTMEYVKDIYHDTKNKEDGIIKKAAFIMYNIAFKHPFTDGNKRTSLITCNAFLEYNGYTVGTLPFTESKNFILKVAKGEKKEKDCERFIRKNISKLIITQKSEKELSKILERINKRIKSKINS